jgi:hypothetical protein
MKILKYINAASFFPKYAPGVKNRKHKMRGKNSKGNKTDFTVQDKTEIIIGAQKMVNDQIKINLDGK